eukprot:gene27033-30560_t
MENLDVMVLRTLRDWRRAGKRALLTTVVRTWGSSPRPVGSIMALAEDGAVVGSVSGGCIEDDLIARYSHAHGQAQEVPLGAPPALVKYGITADEAHRFGLPCGGTIELAIEPLGAHSRIAELLDMLEQRQLVERRLDLATGAVQLAHTTAGNVLELGAGQLTTQHGPRWRLLIIGAGQLSRFLAQIATAMDYHVTVCDPREEYRSAWTVLTCGLLLTALLGGMMLLISGERALIQDQVKDATARLRERELLLRQVLPCRVAGPQLALQQRHRLLVGLDDALGDRELPAQQRLLDRGRHQVRGQREVGGLELVVLHPRLRLEALELPSLAAEDVGRIADRELRGVEVVERRCDHAGADPAHRCGARGKVRRAPLADSGPDQRLLDVRGEVAQGMQGLQGAGDTTVVSGFHAPLSTSRVLSRAQIPRPARVAGSAAYERRQDAPRSSLLSTCSWVDHINGGVYVSDEGVTP